MRTNVGIVAEVKALAVPAGEHKNIEGEVGKPIGGGKVKRTVFGFEPFSALRFFFKFTGTGTPQISIRWKFSDGSMIQPENVTLTNGFAEVPVRSPIASIRIEETGGSSRTVATGVVLGVTL